MEALTKYYISYATRATLLSHFDYSHQNASTSDLTKSVTNKAIFSAIPEVPSPSIDTSGNISLNPIDANLGESTEDEDARYDGDMVVDILADFYNALTNEKQVPYSTFEFVVQRLRAIADVNWDVIGDKLTEILGGNDEESEKIVNRFEEKIHKTVLEVDLNAIAHNLKI